MLQQEFTNDWFLPHKGRWDTLLTALRRKPRVWAVEVGCYEGRATVWMLENIIGTDGHIWCIDPWEPYDEPLMENVNWEEVYMRFLLNTAPYCAGISVMRMDSIEGLTALLCEHRPGCMDLVYVDGAHDSRSVLTDLILGWTLVKPGGILIADDYQWGATAPDGTCPKDAIDPFMEVFEPEFHILHLGVQVFLLKKEV